MAKSVPSGSVAATFRNSVGSFSLSTQLTDYNDERKPSIAIHSFLKRDGGLNEPMGRDPHVVKMNLYFIGDSGLAQLKAFVAATDRDPLGTLDHPMFGSMQVAYLGLTGGTHNYESALDMYIAPVSFRENSVDQTLSFNAPSVQAQSQLVSTYTQSLLTSTLLYAANTITTITSYTGFALAYATAAVASSLVSSVDSTLQSRLGTVKLYAENSATAVRADPLATSDALTYPVLATIELVYASCLDLDAATRTQKPTLIFYTVPTKTHVATLAALFYGKDGRARIPEILANNPNKIPNPAGILAGTVLVMASPTAPQN